MLLGRVGALSFFLLHSIPSFKIVEGNGDRIYSFIRVEVASAFSLSKPEPAPHARHLARLCEYKGRRLNPCQKTFQSREGVYFHEVVKRCLCK